MSESKYQMNIESERAAFEARFSKSYDLDFDEETEEYKDPGDQALWYGWKACAALTQSERVPEGCKLVPVEPTQAMISAGWKVGLIGMDREGPQAIYRAMLAAALEQSERTHLQPAGCKVVKVGLLERCAKHLSEGRLDGPAANELRALLEVKP